MSGDVVTIIVALIGAGGLWETVRRVVEARSKRSELRARAPEAIQDSSVQRAQQALLVMEGSLNAAVARAEAAEAEVRELRGHIDQLEHDIDSIRTQLNEATVQLNQATNQLSTLRDQIPSHNRMET